MGQMFNLHPFNIDLNVSFPASDEFISELSAEKFTSQQFSGK